MGKVGIIGVGQSAFVRTYPGSIRELVFESFREAVKDARISGTDVDATIVCSAPEYDRQRSPAGVIAEYLGLNPQPTFYAETLCSSGSTGLKLAYSLVASGLHDVVMVIGFQIMSQLTSAESQERMGRGADILWESPFGTMMPAYYAMHARAHMAKFGTTLEDLALVRVKAATYGQLNPNAVYRKPVTLDQFQDPGSFLAAPWPARSGPAIAAPMRTAVLVLLSPARTKHAPFPKSRSGSKVSAPPLPQSTWRDETGSPVLRRPWKLPGKLTRWPALGPLMLTSQKFMTVLLSPS